MSCRVLCTVILRILRMGACLAGWGIGRDQGRAESCTYVMINIINIRFFY